MNLWPILRSIEFFIPTKNKKLLRNFLVQKVGKIQETFKSTWIPKFLIKKGCKLPIK